MLPPNGSRTNIVYVLGILILFTPLTSDNTFTYTVTDKISGSAVDSGSTKYILPSEAFTCIQF